MSALIKDPPPGAPVPPILPPQDGYLFLDKAKFASSFAADVSPDLAEFMADSQAPWGSTAPERQWTCFGQEVAQHVRRPAPAPGIVAMELATADTQ